MSPRPVGVVAVSIVLGLGALLLLVLALGSGVMAIAVPHMAIPSNGVTSPPPPGLLLASMLFTTFLYLALAGWSGATVVGLFRMRNWARISAMLIGAGLVFFGLLGILSIAVVRAALPNMPLPPNANPAALRMVFGFMIFWGLGMAAVGVWLLVYFVLRSTRDAFGNATTARSAQALDNSYTPTPHATGPFTDFSVAQPLGTQHFDAGTGDQPSYLTQQNSDQLVAEPLLPPSRRPISMTVVAVLLLIGSFFSLLQMASPAPLFFMSVPLSGWPAHITSLMLCAVSGVAGLGLLKLQKPAWMLAIGLFCVYTLNGIAVLFPGGQTRFTAYMHAVMSHSSMGMATFPFDQNMLYIFAVTGAVVAVAFGGTMLFLLWRARRSFDYLPPDQAAS